ncbi:28716_t:CDS:2, partial [Racocetra persica]
MGNCLETLSDCFKGRQKERGYKLGTTDATDATDATDTSMKGTDSSSRSATAEAAEKRAQQAQNRGVQKGGGKLSKRLDERQKSPVGSDEHPPDSNLD